MCVDEKFSTCINVADLMFTKFLFFELQIKHQNHELKNNIVYGGQYRTEDRPTDICLKITSTRQHAKTKLHQAGSHARH